MFANQDTRRALCEALLSFGGVDPKTGAGGETPADRFTLALVRDLYYGEREARVVDLLALDDDAKRFFAGLLMVLATDPNKAIELVKEPEVKVAEAAPRPDAPPPMAQVVKFEVDGMDLNRLQHPADVSIVP